MRAARIHSWGASPVVEEVSDPSGETVVRVEAAAVAHLDLTVASGKFQIKPELPHIGGVEGCGIVVTSDVHEPGTRVMLRGGGLGLMKSGTWAELVAVRSKNVAPLPADLSPELGATYFVPTTTAYTALHEVGRLGTWVAEDEVVVVAGAAGAVGSMVVQLALRAGATVIGIVAPEQASRLPDGVEAVRLDDDARAAELTRDRPATLLVDTLGGQGLAARSRWVQPGGRAASIGYVAGTDVNLDLPNWLLEDVALLPVNMIRRDAAARQHAPMLARLLAAGELTLDVESFDLADVGKALDLLATGGLRGRAVITP